MQRECEELICQTEFQTFKTVYWNKLQSVRSGMHESPECSHMSSDLFSRFEVKSHCLLVGT